MKLGPNVGLTDLFTLVPHLLDTCVGGADHAVILPKLRLVNKEAGRAALRALSTYRLSLTGPDSKKVLRRAALLKSTCLHTFRVNLRLGCKCG